MPPRPSILTITLNPAIDLAYIVPALRVRGADFVRATTRSATAGGKGINVSRVLEELGIASTAAFTCGGPWGAMLVDLLRSNHFEQIALPIAQPTRANVTLLAAASPPFKFNERGPRVTAKEASVLLTALQKLIAGRRWVVLAGSLPPGLNTNFYARLMRFAHAAGAQVALDCEGAPMQAALRCRPDLIKPNHAELEGILGRPVRSRKALVAAIHELIARGARRVVVSAGRNEVIAGDAQGLWCVTPPHITQLSPLGAGDSMVAGLVSALARSTTLPAALRIGVASGAACAAEPDGTLAQHLRIKFYLPQVKIEPL